MTQEPQWIPPVTIRSLVRIVRGNPFFLTSFSLCHVKKVILQPIYNLFMYVEWHYTFHYLYMCFSCNLIGFGVGHMRDTKTKGPKPYIVLLVYYSTVSKCILMKFTLSSGIWVWGNPVEMVINGVKTSVIFLDTEGFESVGKSNVYDDRYHSERLKSATLCLA